MGLETDKVTAALDGVYSAVVVRDILEREKRKGQRIPIIKSVLAFYVRTEGPHSDYVANTYSGMCMIYENLGDPKAAVEYGQTAERIFIELYGPDTPELCSVYHNLLFPLRALDDKTAVAYYTAQLHRLENQ